MSSVIIVRYSDNPLANDAIVQELNIAGQAYTYLVATAAQEFMRRDLAPPHQVHETKGPQLVFHKVIRHALPAAISLVTRAEERVTLQRAMRDITSDDARFQRLKCDSPAWRDVLAQLDEQGINVTEGLPTELQQRLVHPEIEELLIALQRRSRELLTSEGYRTFEQAAFQFLRSSRFAPTPHVVMEGFTFLTPLQQHFVAECLKRPVTLHFVHPFRDEQSGFAIIRRTYSDYANRLVRPIVGSPASVTDDIATLRNSLFLAEAPLPVASDNTVTFSVFNHRHGEAKRCIERIREYLSQEPDWQIAVVTRDPAGFHMLLQEEAEIQDPSLSLGIPPRLLLLTPVGRFVLTLYEIWKNGLNIDADQFEAILTSGWLGGAVQETVERFRAVKAQMFARCRSAADWRESLIQLKQLRQTLPTEMRLAPASVSLAMIGFWEDSLAQVERLCERLFSSGQGSISDHVAFLLDALNTLASEEMFRKEREVVESIREALLQVADATSMAINATEFGEVLNSLVREYERAVEETDDSSALQRKIWVTTPEGIDGYTTDVVFFLGCDNKHIPRPYSDPWPFYTNEVAKYQERERYMFLAVVRAASKRLHFTYARTDENGVYRPSPYLDEARELLSNPDWEEETIPMLTAAPDAVPPPALGQARRQEYKLDEIAHFALCPYRYKLERLDRRARQYNDEIHVRLHAQGIWLGRIMEYVMEERRVVRGEEEFNTVFQQAKRSVEQSVKEAFPGFRPLDWIRVDRYVKRSVRSWRDFYLSQIANARTPYPLRVVAVPQTTLTIIDDEQTRRVVIPLNYAFKIGQFDYPQTEDRLRDEWLIPGRKETVQGMAQVDGMPVFANLYDVVQWWASGLRLAFNYCQTRGDNLQRDQNLEQQHAGYTAELLTWMERIEAGQYPKNPGAHCQYCPVRNACLGVKP